MLTTDAPDPRLEAFLQSQQGTEQEFARRRQRSRSAFAKVRKAEENYSRRLRKLASHIADIIHDFTVGNDDLSPESLPFASSGLVNLLQRYADILTPWATSVASRMIAEVARRDQTAWRAHSQEMSRNLEQEILETPIGQAMREFLQTQVQLITSLPREAAQRVHDIAVGNLYSGERYSSLIEHIMETGLVTKNRATLIARTETARVSSTMTMVRAQQIGGTHYIWRSMRDEIVRPSHIKMEGTVCEWAQPPQVEIGKFYHAGMTFNCRCYCEPIIPDRFLPPNARN